MNPLLNLAAQAAATKGAQGRLRGLSKHPPLGDRLHRAAGLGEPPQGGLGAFCCREFIRRIGFRFMGSARRVEEGSPGAILLNLLILGLLLSTHAAYAHSFQPAVLDLHERNAGQFDVAWKIPVLAAEGLLADSGDLQPQFPAHCRRVEGLGSADTPSTDEVTPSGLEPAFWRIDCGTAGLRGSSISVNGLAGSRLDVIVRITWRDGATLTGVLYSGDDQLAVPARRAGGLGRGAPARTVLWNYGRLGVEHILLGFDHLLFVLGLLLLVDSWGMLLKTISAFTVAHTLTLALAILQVIHVPTAPVEALIAVSIALVALELTRPADEPPTLTKQYPWLVAFAFGLLHGLGFAGALTQIGLPPDQVPLSLLSFNLGVEAGQLMFVTAMVVPLTVARRLLPAWTRARLVPAYAIGALAVAWTFERIAAFYQ